jgi:hypothetical protein
MSSFTSNPTPAPADARPHPRWPLWRVVLAYVVLAGMAAAAIWYVDLRAQRSGETPAANRVAPE